MCFAAQRSFFQVEYFTFHIVPKEFSKLWKLKKKLSSTIHSVLCEDTTACIIANFMFQLWIPLPSILAVISWTAVSGWQWSRQCYLVSFLYSGCPTVGHGVNCSKSQKFRHKSGQQGKARSFCWGFPGREHQISFLVSSLVSQEIFTQKIPVWSCKVCSSGPRDFSIQTNIFSS